jgi:catechol 2,3-dioxygenase-like lactoylglutathione lyase family enzyme
MTGDAAVAVRPIDVDLGVCRGVRFDRGAEAWVILLPGANYPTTAPLLWFAREAALAAGRNVLAVVDSRKGSTDDPQHWVEERAEAALRHAGDEARPMLVAKSITSLAAPLAARLSLPAVWLTPLINDAGASVDQAVIDGLAAASAPFLLIGGSIDPSWDGARARSFAEGEAIEIRDADHLLQVPGDPARSIDALHSVSAAVNDFIAAVEGAASGHEAQLTGIDHVQLVMPPNGEDQARDFYGSLLGLREVAKPEPLAQRGGCWFVGPGIHLHLGVTDEFRPARKAHSAFRVRSLDALRAQLTSSRVAVEDDDSLPGVRRFYAADPFGNRIEFIEEADGGFTQPQ